MPEISKIKVNGTEYDIASKGLELVGSFNVDDYNRYNNTNMGWSDCSEELFNLISQARVAYVYQETSYSKLLCCATVGVENTYQMGEDEDYNYISYAKLYTDITALLEDEYNQYGMTKRSLVFNEGLSKALEESYNDGGTFRVELYR